MSLAGRVSVLAAVVCSLVAAGANGATNMYLEFQDPSFQQIEVLSWSHGFVQPASPTRSTVEQSAHQNFTFTKYLDASSNTILKYCWSGRQIAKATLTCYRSGDSGKPVAYLKVEMQHVVISNYSISGGPGDIPVENVSLDYGLVQYTYIDHRQADGGAMLKASASRAPCTATLANGKVIEVRSLSVGKSTASFAASGAGDAASETVKLTCGKASVALSGAKIGSSGGKVTATGGSMQ